MDCTTAFDDKVHDIADKTCRDAHSIRGEVPCNRHLDAAFWGLLPMIHEATADNFSEGLGD